MEMKLVLSSRGSDLPGWWQVCLCVALIGLMLYNPFASLCGTNDGLCYDQLARNRATVGASELQHFSPITDSTIQSQLDLDTPATGLLPVVWEAFSLFDLQQAFAPQPDLLNEFWNKPPPAR